MLSCSLLHESFLSVLNQQHGISFENNNNWSVDEKDCLLSD